MNGQIKLTLANLLKWLVFVVYIIMLIKLIVLKNGDAIIISKLLKNKLTWEQKVLAINFVPFKTIYYYLSGNESFFISITNILGNIFAFSPMGFLIPILFKKFKRIGYVLVISLFTSISIEIVQLIFSLGSCDIDDVILNLMGAVVGFIVYKIFRQYYKYKLGCINNFF